MKRIFDFVLRLDQHFTENPRPDYLTHESKFFAGRSGDTINAYISYFSTLQSGYAVHYSQNEFIFYFNGQRLQSLPYGTIFELENGITVLQRQIT